MSLRYSGPATLHADGRTFDVEAVLSTNTSDGTYSWGGRLTTLDIGALAAAKRGGTLTLPGLPDAEVHVVLAEPDPDGGVLLRITGAGRAPYETHPKTGQRSHANTPSTTNRPPSDRTAGER